MSAHDPISPEEPTEWASLLGELTEQLQLGDGGLPIAWSLHAWANEQLDSAAIRIDGSEGLIGRAPARWRLLCHIDAPGFAVAVLDGRAPMRLDSVLASLLVAPERPPIVTVRGERSERPEGKAVGERTGVASPAGALAALVDLALGRLARVSGSAAALPAAVRLAAALALYERGCGFAWTAPPRRGARRARAFVATRDPAMVRRQLAAVEAALRKRSRR